MVKRKNNGQLVKGIVFGATVTILTYSFIQIACDIKEHDRIEQEHIIEFKNGSFGTITITDTDGNTIEYQGSIEIGDYPYITYEIMGTNVVMEGARLIGEYEPGQYKNWYEEKDRYWMLKEQNESEDK